MQKCAVKMFKERKKQEQRPEVEASLEGFRDRKDNLAHYRCTRIQQAPYTCLMHGCGTNTLTPTFHYNRVQGCASCKCTRLDNYRASP